MRKLVLILISFLMGILVSLAPCTEIFAKNNNKVNNASGSKALTIVNNKGEKVLNGSVLDPSEDELFVLLHSVLASVLRGDLENVSIVLSSIADPSKRFIVPKNAVRLQNKKINKKNGKYLSVNLFNIKTPSGITIPPSALQKDNYKLRIVNDKNKLDVSTESFNYQTPVLIVGMVGQKNSGSVVIEDLFGNAISDNVVGLNGNGSFFTEVRANMIKPLTKNKSFVKSGLKNQLTDNDLSVGVIHVVSDKDLFAIAPLSNDPDVNGALADNSLTVNEGTTLTANIAKEDESLALEVAKKELDDLANNKETDFGDLNCDVNEFADRCDTKDDSVLSSFGEDVKNLINNPQCNLPDFVTSFLQSSDASDVAKGYCEFVGRTEDDSRICSNYSMVLSDFKSGNLKQLPCPPPSCIIFQNIKPPKCVISKGFCEDGSTNKECISKPKKDLFCLKVPDELAESDCVDDNTDNSNDIQPNWVVAINSEGNEYCVPSNSAVLSEIKTSSKTFSSPEDIAEECEYNFCHRQCDNKSSSDATNCHFDCNVQFGRIINCTDVNSPYFSIQCCNPIKRFRIFKTTNLAYELASGVSKPPSFSISRGPVFPKIADCLCRDSNNFNEIGYAYEESKLACKEECPSGYERDEESNSCFPICPEGFIRNANGFCKKDCPAGFIKDALGICTCPEGQKKDSLTGFCISPVSCGSNLLPNPKANELNQAACICPFDLPYFDGRFCVAQCPGGTYPNIDPKLPLGSPITCNSRTATQCKSPFIFNPDEIPSCRCPDSLPYSYLDTCVAVCPVSLTSQKSSIGLLACLCSDGSSPDATGKCSVIQQYTCTPGEVSTFANPCTCASGATVSYNGTCSCTNGQTYAAAGCPGSGSSSSSSSGGSSTICAIGQVSTSRSPCTCASGAIVSSYGTCQCTNGQAYAVAGCPGSGSSSSSSSGGSGNSSSSSSGGSGNSSSSSSGGSGSSSSSSSGGSGNSSQQVTLSNVSFTGNNVTLTYAKNFPECVLLVSSDASKIYHNGVSAYNLLCLKDGGTPTNSLSSLPLYKGLQVKACKANASSNPTGIAEQLPVVCSSLVTVTTNDTITLTNVVIEANGDLSVTYSKNFSGCVGLRQRDPDLRRDDVYAIEVTSQNQFCGTSGTETVAASALRSSVQVGTKVKLCNNVSNFCSEPIAITAPPTCTNLQVSTAANPCTCASGATIGSAGYCECTNGAAYSVYGCGGGLEP